MSESLLIPANAALDCFAHGTTIAIEPRVGVVVSWKSGGRAMRRRWATMHGQSFYPTWHRYWGHGGTATTALSQLVRWVRGNPVLPLSTWQWWMRPECNLARDRSDECLEILTVAGWPEHVDCVLCGNQIFGGLDWWCLNGVSGPCCTWRSGCRQKPLEEANDG